MHTAYGEYSIFIKSYLLIGLEAVAQGSREMNWLESDSQDCAYKNFEKLNGLDVDFKRFMNIGYTLQTCFMIVIDLDLFHDK